MKVPVVMITALDGRADRIQGLEAGASDFLLKPFRVTQVLNAFKHGLEPKAEGGTLVLRAEVSHGKLVVTVKDSGVGYFPAKQDATSEASQGGFGLKNIRDRLALIYGEQGSLSIRAADGASATASTPSSAAAGWRRLG